MIVQKFAHNDLLWGDEAYLHFYTQILDWL